MKVIILGIASFLFIFFLSPFIVVGQERNLLTNASNERLLVDQVLDPEDWVPFPAYENRDAWKEIARGYEAGIHRNSRRSPGF